MFAASLMSAGPLVSVFAMAPLSRRFGPQRVLAVMLAPACGDRGRGARESAARSAAVAIFLMGCCTIGSMTGINGMTAALYPARVRNTGMGWALGLAGWAGSAGHGWAACC